MAATGLSRGSRRSGNSDISTSVSRWLLWLATMMAGPPSGNRSRWRTFSPSTTSTSARTTPAKNSHRRNLLTLPCIRPIPPHAPWK